MSKILVLALVGLLVASAAFCFVRYLYWSFSYSATLGLASKEQDTRHAHHLACCFSACSSAWNCSLHSKLGPFGNT